MSIYEAIFNRYSVREYRMEKIEPERLEALKRYLKTVALLDEEKPVEFEIVDNTDKKLKVHGLWKTEAPYYLAVYCGDDRLSMRNAGYAAEQAVLYLTSKELGTCYLGATKAGEDKKDGLKRFLVIAFGKASAKPFRDSSMAHRNSLAALCAFKDEPGEQVKSILRAARLAPSSFNSQPWRFVVYSDRLYIFMKKAAPFSGKGAKAFKEFNMGIMLSHIMLAAEEYWMNMETLVEEQFAKKDYKNGSMSVRLCFIVEKRHTASVWPPPHLSQYSPILLKLQKFSQPLYFYLKPETPYAKIGKNKVL